MDMEQFNRALTLVGIIVGVLAFFYLFLDAGEFKLTGFAIDIGAGDSYVIRSLTPDTVEGLGVVSVSLKVVVQDIPSMEDFYFIDEVIPTGFVINDSGTGDTSEAGHIKWVYIEGYDGASGNATNTTVYYSLIAPNFTTTGFFEGDFGFTSNPSSLLDGGGETILGETFVNVVLPDTTSPALSNLVPNGNNFEITNTVVISATVTDNINVQSVTARIYFPNGSSSQLTLSSPGGSTYSNSFTGTSSLGRYNITFTAIDNSSNSNTATSYFNVVVETTPPTFEGIIPIAGSSFESGGAVVIGANVTDNFVVEEVTSTITLPNSTVVSLDLDYVSGSYYSNSFNVLLGGQYNITFIAEDDSFNVNHEYTYFNVPAVCGDGLCNLGEVCDICVSDCGVCPSVISTSSGGGGGGSTASLDEDDEDDLKVSENLSQVEFDFSQGVIYRVVAGYENNEGVNLQIQDYNEFNVSSLKEGVVYYNSFILNFSEGFVEGILYFKIPLYWIQENNVDLEKVALYSLNEEGDLDEKATQKITEDEGYAYFSSKVDSLDPVVITGKVYSTEEESGVDANKIVLVVMIILGVFIIIIGIIIAIRYFRKNPLKNSSVPFLPGSGM